MYEAKGLLVGLKLVFPADHYDEIDSLCQGIDTTSIVGLSQLLSTVLVYVNENLDIVNVYSTLLSEIMPEPELELKFIEETDTQRAGLDKDYNFEFFEFELTIIVATSDTEFSRMKPEDPNGLNLFVKKLKSLPAEKLFGVEIFLLPIEEKNIKSTEKSSEKKKTVRPERRPGRDTDSSL